jgi:hypothetical protein
MKERKRRDIATICNCCNSGNYTQNPPRVVDIGSRLLPVESFRVIKAQNWESSEPVLCRSPHGIHEEWNIVGSKFGPLLDNFTGYCCTQNRGTISHG